MPARTMRPSRAPSHPCSRASISARARSARTPRRAGHARPRRPVRCRPRNPNTRNLRCPSAAWTCRTAVTSTKSGKAYSAYSKPCRNRSPRASRTANPSARCSSKACAKAREAKAFLGEIESDSQQLSVELTRIHLLSLSDDLTILPNRRAFLRRLQDEVSRVQRYGNPLSLALIDLDGFKSVNDKLGHAAGDEVL